MPVVVALNVMCASPVVGFGYTLSSVPIAVSTDVSSATISNERQSARLTANVRAVVLIPQALLALTETEPAAVPQLDVYAQLEKIAELKEKGILTEAEFQEQKAKLLSQ